MLRRRTYEIRADTAFDEVLSACAEAPRPGQDGTWITPEMHAAYLALHRLGHAHSVEAWKDGALVGGLYGVALGRVFFGESMFTRAPDASKAAFVTPGPGAVRRRVPAHRLPGGDRAPGPLRRGGRARRRFLQLLGPAVQGGPPLHPVFASLGAPALGGTR